MMEVVSELEVVLLVLLLEDFESWDLKSGIVDGEKKEKGECFRF